MSTKRRVEKRKRKNRWISVRRQIFAKCLDSTNDSFALHILLIYLFFYNITIHISPSSSLSHSPKESGAFNATKTIKFRRFSSPTTIASGLRILLKNKQCDSIKSFLFPYGTFYVRETRSVEKLRPHFSQISIKIP